MPRKIRKTKGIRLQEPKTTRTLISNVLRFAILSDYISGDNDIDISRKYEKDKRHRCTVEIFVCLGHRYT